MRCLHYFLLLLGYGGIAFSQSAGGIIGTSTTINYAPVAFDQQLVINSVQPITITLNAYDANGDALTFAIITNPPNGSLSGFDRSTGQVTYTPPSQLSGSDSLTFTVTDGIATSEPATVGILLSPPPDFGFTSNVNNVTISSGQPANVTLSVTPENDFADNVGFSCGAASGVTCDFNPATVTPNGSSVTTSLTISLGKSATSQRARWLVYCLGFCLTPCFVFLLRYYAPHRQSRRPMLLILATIAFVALTIACGGGGSSTSSAQSGGGPLPTPQTPQPTMTSVSIIASSTGTSSISHTLTVNVTITH